MANGETFYPIKLSIDYPDRQLNKLSSFFRLFYAIPILIVILTLPGVSAYFSVAGNDSAGFPPIFYTVYVFVPLILTILFRQKYPRWWYDWNIAVLKFAMRVNAYFMLLRDEYPSTDEEQAVRVEIPYPNAAVDLNRWLPLVKWFLAIPHVFVLCFLSIALVICTIIAWFAILFTGRYPRGMFDFAVGVYRWSVRVTAYCFILTTDKYPPFRLRD